MFNIDDNTIKSLILKGHFGLEKESLRISDDGHIVHTPHQFIDNPRISRDFCENQTEINTDVCSGIDEVYAELTDYTDTIWNTISADNELLWPFSNPPYIIDESDIPIAQFYGSDRHKTEYRKYLADKYGRFKMTFSGIHFNYSFADELLLYDYESHLPSDNRINNNSSDKAAPDHAVSDNDNRGNESSDRSSNLTQSFTEYKNSFYLELAKQMSAYGWLIVCLTAASPILDISFVERGRQGDSLFTGMASPRCSENGYWNFFSPVFNYSSIKAYADSIRRYIDLCMIASPHELYYPVRLKPSGENNLESLCNNGVDHIELRMIDLNPYCYSGIDIRDIRFAHLMLIWLSCRPSIGFSESEQIYAIQNFRNAARYNLSNYKIRMPDGNSYNIISAAESVLDEMSSFYESWYSDAADIISYQRSKLTNPSVRYAARVKKDYEHNYVEKGLELAKAYKLMSTNKHAEQNPAQSL